MILFGNMDEMFEYIVNSAATSAGRARRPAMPARRPASHAISLSGSRRTPCTGQPEGKEIFVVDGHTHFWDGSPENQNNIHGKQFIECFYAYHIGPEPARSSCGRRASSRNTAPTISIDDLFIDGPDDMAIVQSTYLKDFYKNGFNTIERNAEWRSAIRTASSSTAPSIRATARRRWNTSTS